MGGSEDVSDKKKHHNLTIGIIAFLVLVNVGVHHTSQSGNSNEYAGVQVREKKSKSANSQQKSSNEEYAEPADEVQDVVTRWQSVWQQEHAAVNAACKPIEDMLVAGERSGRASFEGTVIGYRKKPGNNGLGDRLKSITGMAIVAMAMERPLRVSVKSDAFDFVNILKTPKSIQIPWHHEWSRFEKEKVSHEKNGKVHVETFACVPDEETMDDYTTTNTTMFYAAEGGDSLVDGWWLEKYMTSKGKGPKHRGDWGHVAKMCIARALFRPGEDLLEQLNGDIERVATMPMGSTYGNAPNTLLLGLHARYVGRSHIESGSIRQTDTDIANQIKYSWKMTLDWADQTRESSAPRQAVWLVASDNPATFFVNVKKFVKKHAGEMPGNIPVSVAQSTAGEVKHIKFDKSRPAMFRMWLDWFLLSEANACSFGRSGFPLTACCAASRRFLSHGNITQGYGGFGSWQDLEWETLPKEQTFEELRRHSTEYFCPQIY